VDTRVRCEPRDLYRAGVTKAQNLVYITR